MTSENFAYWLQGYFELAGKDADLTKEHVDIIQKHLHMVFEYEIDPSMGNEEMQNKLSEIHNGAEEQKAPPVHTTFDHHTLIRC